LAKKDAGAGKDGKKAGSGKGKDDGSSDGTSDSSSDGKTSDASVSLYQGFMTGWSYEACRGLYYQEGELWSVPKSVPDGQQPKPSSKDKAELAKVRNRLLPWLSTYANLVSEWAAVGADGVSDDLDHITTQVAFSRSVEGKPDKPSGETKTPDLTSISANLEQMAKDLISIAGSASQSSSSGAQPSPSANGASAVITKEQFDSDYDQILGAVRAQLPYAYYAVLFGQYCSRLQHPREGDKLTETAEGLRGCLSELRSVLPEGAYDIIENDLYAYAGKRSVIDRISHMSETAEGRAKRLGVVNDELRRNIQTWSDLLVGADSPRDILNVGGSACLYGSLILAALALVGAAVTIVYVVYIWFNSLPWGKQTLKDILNPTNAKTLWTDVTSIGTAAGITILAVVSQAWNWFKGFEKAAILFFAKVWKLRRHVIVMDMSKFPEYPQDSQSTTPSSAVAQK
jgi:hypothetical protein